MPDQREQALSFLRLNGPSLPVQVAKALNTNILFASAVLSELSSRKKLLVSHAAIGGSKVYFLQGQERRLGEKLYPTFKGKPREAYELLRDKQVLRDSTLEPWQRIAYRELKDFATALTVSFGDEAELFWKFHLLSDEAAKPFVEQIMQVDQVQEEVPVQEVVPEPVKESEAEVVAEEVEEAEVEETKSEEEEEEELIEDEGNKEDTESDEDEDAEEVEEAEIEEEEEDDDQDEEAEVEKPQINMQEMVQNLKSEILKELRPKLERELRVEMKQDTLLKPKIQKLEGKFYSRIKEYLDNNMIEIIKEEMLRKDKEFDFIVKIPSPFGHLQYYLKAKDKKAISEADVSQAHSEGQLKRMPIIFLITGKLGKKASVLVEQKYQGQLIVKEF